MLGADGCLRCWQQRHRVPSRCGCDGLVKRGGATRGRCWPGAPRALSRCCGSCLLIYYHRSARSAPRCWGGGGAVDCVSRWLGHCRPFRAPSPDIGRVHHGLSHNTKQPPLPRLGSSNPGEARDRSLCGFLGLDLGLSAVLMISEDRSCNFTPSRHSHAHDQVTRRAGQGEPATAGPSRIRPHPREPR